MHKEYHLTLFIFAFLIKLINVVTAETNNNATTYPSLVVRVNPLEQEYYVNVSFGSAAQIQKLSLDLLSPLIYLYDENGKNSDTSFDPSMSSTCQTITDQIFSTSNINKTFSTNVLARNDFTIDNIYEDMVKLTSDNSNLESAELINLQNLTFLKIESDIAFSSNNEGSLGLSSNAVIPNSNNLKLPYSSSVLDVLYMKDYIKSPSFSLLLNKVPELNSGGVPSDNSTEQGNLLFGAVDPANIYGQFQGFPPIPFLVNSTNESKLYKQGLPILPLNTIFIENKNGQTLNLTAINHREPVLLNIQQLHSELPLDIVLQIAIQLEAVFVKEVQKWIVPCSVSFFDVSFIFYFDNLPIIVPISDLISSTNNTIFENEAFNFQDNELACFLDITSNLNTGYSVLGNSILKNMFLTFEKESGQIAVGQAGKAASFSSNLVAKHQKKIQFKNSVSKKLDLNFSTYNVSDSELISTNITDNGISPLTTRLRISRRTSTTSLYSTATAVLPIEASNIPYATNNTNSKLFSGMTLSSSSMNRTKSDINVSPFMVTLSSNTVITQTRQLYSTSAYSEVAKTVTSFAKLSINSAASYYSYNGSSIYPETTRTNAKSINFANQLSNHNLFIFAQQLNLPNLSSLSTVIVTISITIILIFL